MRSADLPLHKAIGAALVVAFTGQNCAWVANPGQDRSMPYGVLGIATETDAFRTKTTDGSDMTHTLRIYARTMVRAKELASLAIEALTGTPLSLGSGFYASGKGGLEMNEVIPDRDEQGDVYGAAIRIRFRIGHTNAP